jgi:hypothetical protein
MDELLITNYSKGQLEATLAPQATGVALATY